MKKLVIIFTAFTVLSGFTYISKKEKEVKANHQEVRLVEKSKRAFNVGEELTYRMHYGFVDAGEAKLKVETSWLPVNNKPVMHVVGEGKSLKAFDLFFKVRDRYESYISIDELQPQKFVRRVNEGGYKINQDYIFHPEEGKVKTDKGKEFEVPMDVQDMISAFYYARNIDFSNAKEGDTYTINCFLDDQLYPLQIKYMGKETIKIRNGKYDCLRFAPVVQEGRIFEDESALSVWVTDDGNKVPVLAKAKILVGSIKMELTDYSGLKYPIAKVD